MSKRITLDNLKTFLTQLKTHITDPITNDVSTLTTKVRNAENNITTANSNISSVQQSLNDKINSKTNVQSEETITTNNNTIGYFKNIKINGNTHYKKSDGTYTDTWESGVSLESVGEKEKDSNGKYPIEVVSNSNVLNVRDSNAIISGSLIEYLENNGIKITSLTSMYNFVKYNIILRKNVKYILHVKAISNNGTMGVFIINNEKTNAIRKDFSATTTFDIEFTPTEENNTITFYSSNGEKGQVYTFEDIKLAKCDDINKEDKRTVLLDSPLRKVGAIADVLDLEKMKVVRKIKSITIDGTITNWVQAKIDNNSILWYITLNDAISHTPSMCDKLKNDDTLWGHDVSGAYRIDETKAFQIRTDKTISNLSALTTWLQSNPITVVYQLATPTTEDIEVSSNTLTDFVTSCTLTIDNTIKGNIECNEVVGLIPSVEKDSTRLANLETDNTTNKSNITNLQNSLSNAINNKFALQVNVKHYINNSELLTYVDTDNTQYKFKKSGLYKITVTKANNQTSGISFCDTSLDFETKGNVLVGYNVGLYEPVSSSLVMYIDKTKTYEFFGFALSDYHGATEYIKYRGTDFKTNLQGSNILIELIKEC